MSSFLTYGLMVLAQGAATTQSSGPKPPWYLQLFSSQMFPIFLVFIVLMLVMSGSKRKQEKQRQQTLDSMKRGDRIQTIGGILGTIVEVRDHEVVVKVDEGNNTKIKFARSAVAKVVTEEDRSVEK